MMYLRKEGKWKQEADQLPSELHALYPGDQRTEIKNFQKLRGDTLSILGYEPDATCWRDDDPKMKPFVGEEISEKVNRLVEASYKYSMAEEMHRATTKPYDPMQGEKIYERFKREMETAKKEKKEAFDELMREREKSINWHRFNYNDMIKEIDESITLAKDRYEYLLLKSIESKNAKNRKSDEDLQKKDKGKILCMECRNRKKR